FGKWPLPLQIRGTCQMPWGLHLAPRLPRTEMDQTRIVFAGPSTRLHRRRSVRRGIQGASAQAAKPSSRKPTRSRGSRLLVATHCRCISRRRLHSPHHLSQNSPGPWPCGIDQVERLSLHSVPRDTVPDNKSRRGVVPRDVGLRLRANRAVLLTERLHFAEIAKALGAVDGWRGRRTELAGLI